MDSPLGLPRNAPNNQTWCVVRKVHDHAVVAVVWDHQNQRYNVEEVTSGDRPHAIHTALECSRAGS